MTTTEQRFDEVLDAFDNHTLFAGLKGEYLDPLVLMRRRPIVDDHWRERFGNAEWNVWMALHRLGLHWIGPAQLTPHDPHYIWAVEGFTDTRGVWVRPNTACPFRAATHELAHNVLRHVEWDAADDVPFEVKLMWEAEAEAAALLVCDTLGYPDGRDLTLSSFRLHFIEQPIEQTPDRELVKGAARQILEAGGWCERPQAA